MGMSILTTKLVPIPKECTASVNNKILTITGPIGTNTYDFNHIMSLIDITKDSQVRLRLWNGDRISKSKLNTASSQIQNMIKGAMNGFKYKLRVVYKHFPISFTISDDGKVLNVMNYLGQKNKREFTMRGSAIVEMDVERDTLVIKGCNLEDVAQSAGTLQNQFKPRGFDFRVFLDGIFISSKEAMVINE